MWPHEELGAGSHEDRDWIFLQLSGMEILTQISFDLGENTRRF